MCPALSSIAHVLPHNKKPRMELGGFPCGAKYLLSSILLAYWSIETLPSSPTWTRPSARSSITSG